MSRHYKSFLFRDPRKEREFETELRLIAAHSREFQIDRGAQVFQNLEHANNRRYHAECGRAGDLAIGIFAQVFQKSRTRK
jgi:hypothetical protein